MFVGYADAYYRKGNIRTRERNNARKATTHEGIMNFGAELELAGHEVYMMVIQCGTGKHSPVGMEGSAGNGRGSVVMKEARVWLERRKIGAIHVESLDFVAVCTPGSC